MTQLKRILVVLILGAAFSPSVLANVNPGAVSDADDVRLPYAGELGENDIAQGAKYCAYEAHLRKLSDGVQQADQSIGARLTGRAN